MGGRGGRGRGERGRKREREKKNASMRGCVLCSLTCQWPRAFHNVETGFQVSNVN